MDDDSPQQQVASYQRNTLSKHIRSRRQELRDRKQRVEYELNAINAALKALDDNPELERFMEVMQKAGV